MHNVGICPGSGVFKIQAGNVPFPRAFVHRKYRFMGSFSSKIQVFVHRLIPILFADVCVMFVTYRDDVAVPPPGCSKVSVMQYILCKICLAILLCFINVSSPKCNIEQI